MRYWIAALSAASLLISATTDALADKRVAFVVGNGAYKNVPALPNPAVDAKSMAKLLRNVGFEVVEGSNLSRDKMTEKLLDFGKKAEGADVAIFFYAGHVDPDRRGDDCSSDPAVDIGERAWSALCRL